MTYSECIHYLEEDVGFASVPGLERIQNLCDRLGNPEKTLSVIHVAGTNGKGSAVSMLSCILQEAGFTVGTYTSPHLERYNERFTINGTEISDADFAREISLMRHISEKMQKENLSPPTLFEIITGAAFHYFAEKKVDILILEVGLGGKFDATNIIAAPLLSLIMSISIDHVDFLGNSITEIAAEKSGIIKKNCPVVLYSQDELVYNIMWTKAQTLSAPLYCPKQAEVMLLHQSLSGSVFSVKTDLIDVKNLELPLLGNHQINNCIAVLEACAVLRMKGFSLSDESIRCGLKKTRWAGRMEICGKSPLILLDGAHNIDGILQLSYAMDTYFENKKVTLILGVLGDKEYKKMMDNILPHAEIVILTEPLSERRMDAISLAHSISGHDGSVYVEKEIGPAFEKALSVTTADGIILCCGSLYMIGAMRTYIKNR